MATKTLPEAIFLSVFHLDRENGVPLYRQIYQGVRQAILNQQLESGLRLPSSRDLAQILGVSRNTVKDAFEQLLAEGYLEARVGAGTYVTGHLPDMFSPGKERAQMVSSPSPPRLLTPRAQVQARIAQQFSLPSQPYSFDFRIGTPDLTLFPFDLWGRLTARAYRQTNAHQLGYQADRAGYRPLREAIAVYAKSVRGVVCEPEQVIIVAGAQEGLYLAGQLLWQPGEAVWLEDPGYASARGALWQPGVELVHVPVNKEGLDVAEGWAIRPDARAAYITPSHQFPLGYTMSLARRFELLRWAAAANAWIIEDDYDSEFRYSGPPLAALQGLDTNQRVIYVGTFNKVLFPALRLGYLIVPPDLVDAFVGGKVFLNTATPLLPQIVLTEFIQAGHFSRHIRRMRTVYGERYEALVAAVTQQLGQAITLIETRSGMHIAGVLAEGYDDQVITRQARENGIMIPPLSSSYQRQPGRSGLLLGFTTLTVAAIQNGIRGLAAAMVTKQRNMA